MQLDRIRQKVATLTILWFGLMSACTQEGLTPVNCFGTSEECDPTDEEDTDTGTDTDLPDDEGLPTKSAKRGIAYDLLFDADFDALSSGVSWWYNWHYQSDASQTVEEDHNMQFVPMLWGYNGDSDYEALETWLLDHPSVEDLLVMNEPNLVNQANMTPFAAVEYWLEYEAFQERMREQHDRSIRLVGPAMTWGTMNNYWDPVIWLDTFYDAFNESEGRDPNIDVLAFHWYDYGLNEQLTRLEKFGKPFWVTEMANWHTAADWTIDTPEKQIQAMTELVEICETRTDVLRYAWFMGRWSPDPHHTSLFEEEQGKLTELGDAYLEQPWD